MLGCKAQKPSHESPGERGGQKALLAGLGRRAAVLAQCPSARLGLPHQPYVIKEGRETLRQLHSDGAGLLPLQVTHHVSEDHQGLHLEICVVILEHLHDVWQEDLHFSCLYERQSFPFVKRSKTTLAKMLWSLSSSLLAGFLAGGGTGTSAAASCHGGGRGHADGDAGEQGEGREGRKAKTPCPLLSRPLVPQARRG